MFFHFFYRLLDVFHTTSPTGHEKYLSLVFEHIEQDLSAYLDNCPQPGLPEWKIKVLLTWKVFGTIQNFCFPKEEYKGVIRFED